MEQFNLLSDEQLENLTANAIELGTDYWCWIKNKSDVTNTDADKSFSERVLATALEGGEVSIYDTETEEFLGYFSKENIKKGTELMYKNQPSHFADILNENDDSVTADVWFQFVVMGELVYG